MISSMTSSKPRRLLDEEDDPGISVDDAEGTWKEYSEAEAGSDGRAC